MESNRHILVDAILEFADDEFETKESIIELSKENETQLIQRLINITEYYKEQSNNN